MKKLFMMIAGLALVATLCFCGCQPITQAEASFSVFEEVTRDKWATIVYHKETKVMYAVSRNTYNYGTFCLLVNADGTPMLWED
jgi:hypothetical protein